MFDKPMIRIGAAVVGAVVIAGALAGIALAGGKGSDSTRVASLETGTATETATATGTATATPAGIATPTETPEATPTAVSTPGGEQLDEDADVEHENVEDTDADQPEQDTAVDEHASHAATPDSAHPSGHDHEQEPHDD